MKKKHVIQGYATVYAGWTFPWEQYIDIELTLKEATDLAKKIVITQHAGIIKYLWTKK